MSKMSTNYMMTKLHNWISGKLGNITALIPSQASSSNKLADKAFVNSSIATATATFRGTYNLVSDLSLTISATQGQIATALASTISTADNNDYAFVQIPTSDSTPTEIARIDKYKYNGVAWAFEYSLNNSGFTAAQWSAINSGITSAKVGKLDDLPTNSELTALLNGKQNVISDLSTIRSGASAGATAVQPASMASTIVDTVAKSGVFDLSVHNAVNGVPATYADLSAALTALNTLPADYKKGGMSIKFVHTSDNKYVQYRFLLSGSLTDAQFGNPINWQGVDDKPSIPGDNLVKSSGVAEELNIIKDTIFENLELNNDYNFDIDNANNIYNKIDGYWFSLHKVKPNTTIVIGSNSRHYVRYTILKTANISQGNSVDFATGFQVMNITSQQSVVIPEDGNFLLVYTAISGNSYKPDFVSYYGSIESEIQEIQEDVDTLASDIDNAESSIHKLNDLVLSKTNYIEYNGFINSRGKWESSNDYSFYAVPVVEGDNVIIQSTTIKPLSRYSFLTQLDVVWGENANAVSVGGSYDIDIPKNQTRTITIPASVNYILIYTKMIGSTDWDPTSVSFPYNIEQRLKKLELQPYGYPIIIKKISSVQLDIWIPNSLTGKYLIHPLKRESYSLDTTSDGGTEDMLCGDVWVPQDVKDELGNILCSEDINFIFKVDTSVSSFENENYHVGSGIHGNEIMDWFYLYADGNPIDLDSMSDDIICSVFRITFNSKCYACNSLHNTGNVHNYPKLVDGNKILTAEHFVDAQFEIDNKITIKNRLTVKRDHVKFNQLHGGMIQCTTPAFHYALINDNKASRCYFENASNVIQIQGIGDSNPMSAGKQKANEGTMWGENILVKQKMVQENPNRWDKSYIAPTGYSGVVCSYKLYQMPAIVSWYSGTAAAEEFNIGDAIPVVLYRKIDYK